MRLDEIASKQQQRNECKISDVAAYSRTLAFRRHIDEARRALSEFLSVTENPVVSCGGGKDGTAIALLASQMLPGIKVVCANPPNPLPDRSAHIERLKSALDVDWHDVPYDWDVQAVLDGRERYPEGHKQEVLMAWSREHGVDGVVLGIRSQESAKRRYNAARGPVYRVRTGEIRCQPIVHWRAEESLALALILSAPVNPVYEHMDGLSDLNLIHDGTWWPHGSAQAGWIRRYYPDFYDRFRSAERVYGRDTYLSCDY